MASEMASSSSPMPRAVLGTDGVDIANAELAEVLRRRSHGFAFHLVNGQEDGLAAANQQAHQVVVRAGQFGARVDHQDQRIGVFERDFGLVVDLGGDQFRVVGHNAARVHQAELPARPLVLAVDAVAGNAGLVAHNGAAALRQAVE